MEQIPSEEVIRRMAKVSDTCLLAFSRGKDSIAAWLAMRPHFKKIIPVHYYNVPGLSFVDESLKYYEDFFQTKIIRLPNPSFYRMLRNFVFQSPGWAVKTIQKAKLPDINHNLLREVVSGDFNCPDEQGYWIAVGTRANDSPQRRMAFTSHGAIRKNGRQFFPVWDWNKERLIETIRAAGVKLPPEYRIFGRSFDGLDFRFLYGIKKYWPDDYAKILEWFPLAEMEFLRHENRKERGISYAKS